VTHGIDTSVVVRIVSALSEDAGRTFNEAYRVDMLADDKAILDLKSTAQMTSDFPKQLRTYLVLSNLRVGLLSAGDKNMGNVK